MESSGDNIILLFLGQLDEVNCIAADTDGQLRILFRMLLRIQQEIPSTMRNTGDSLSDALGTLLAQG